MSKKKPDFEYERTFSYKFNKWLSGTEDPYVGKVEMKKQRHKKTDAATIQERMREKHELHEKVYDTNDNKILINYDRVYKFLAALFCVILLVLLVWNVSYLPPLGEADRSVNNEVSERYIESGLKETGAVNIVSGMILTYRAFDTFGETNVLFIATCCVMIMLMLEEKALRKKEKDEKEKFVTRQDPILKLTAAFLSPIIFVFAFYIMLNGHISPGGGFSGGAVLGAGMILYQNGFGFKKTQRFFNESIYKVAKISALCTYGLIGSYFYITGANGINNHIPLGIAGHILSSGIILPINLAVGIEVACTMYAFYALFRRGGL